MVFEPGSSAWQSIILPQSHAGLFLICRKQEAIDHVFSHFWEEVYFWDILQRMLKKEFPLHPLRFKFLQIEN